MAESANSERTGDPLAISGRLLVGCGLAAAVVVAIRGHRHVVEWLIPLGLIATGLSLLLRRRQSQIERAQERILDELDGLDPLAKAQVIKAVADQELSVLRKITDKAA